MTAEPNPKEPAVPAEPIPQPDVEPEPEEQPTAPRQPDAEPVKGEIVHLPDRRAEPEQHESTALDRAAEAAMAMPGVPGRDEFLTLAMTAKMLSLSGAAPKAIRNNPHVAFHVAMIGRDLGISPSAAIQQIDVIGEGDKLTVSLSPELLNGQVRRLGLGYVVPVVRTNDICIAVAVGPHGVVDDRCKAQAQSSRSWPAHVDGCRCSGILGDTEFTWEDGQIAGLVGIECTDPRHHSDKCGKYESADRFKCRQGWKTYPKRMLWWRAAGYCTADYFPEAGLGLYSPEEMGAVVDETGRPIDPTTVDLPEGYDKALPAGKGGAAGAGAADDDSDDPAPPDVLWDFQHRIAALPEEWQAELRTRWKNLHRLTGAHISKQPARNVNLINSVLNGVEKQAEAQKWDKGQALAAVTADLAACVAASVYTATFHGDGPVVDPETAEGQPAADPSSGGEKAKGDDVDEAKRLLQQAPTDVLDAVIAAVEPLKRAEVDRNLTHLGEIKTGDVSTAKRRLVIACLRWREQHDGHLPDLFGGDTPPSTEASD